MPAAGRTTVADPAHTPAPHPARLWPGDSTYLPTREGWRYLAVPLDAHARRGVGQALAEYLRTERALDALAMAVQARRQPPGLRHHADRGCPYTAAASLGALARHGPICAMRRSGDCRDNAMAASFLAIRTAQCADSHRWSTRASARTAVFARLETWDNRRRRRSAIRRR